MIDVFDQHMQRVLARLVLEDAATRGLLGALYREGFFVFTDRASAWVWRAFEAGATTVPQLRNEASRLAASDPVRGGLDDLLAAVDGRDQEYVRKHLVDWAQLQKYRRAFDEAKELWNRGDQRGSYELFARRFDEIRGLRIDDADRSWFFEDLDNRIDRRRDDRGTIMKIPTGFSTIDEALNGGVQRGSLGLFFAYSNIGKSMALADQAWGGVRLRQNVLMISLEGGRAYQEDRLDARFMEVRLHALERGEVSAEKLAWARNEYERMRGQLVVRGKDDRPKWTIEDMYAEVQTLYADRGWTPDLVVVDYADFIHNSETDERIRHKRAVEDLNTFAGYRVARTKPGHAVWSATQAVRPNEGADEREHILWPRSIAEAWAKVWPVAYVISINITRSESRENLARLALGKNRFGAAGKVVRIETDYAGGAFHRPGGMQEEVVGARRLPPPPPPGGTT